jgi:hypothetical protein
MRSRRYTCVCLKRVAFIDASRSCLTAEDVIELALLDADVDDLDLIPAKGRVGRGTAAGDESFGVRGRGRGDICE